MSSQVRHSNGLNMLAGGCSFDERAQFSFLVSGPRSEYQPGSKRLPSLNVAACTLQSGQLHQNVQCVVNTPASGLFLWLRLGANPQAPHCGPRARCALPGEPKKTTRCLPCPLDHMQYQPCDGKAMTKSSTFSNVFNAEKISAVRVKARPSRYQMNLFN